MTESGENPYEAPDDRTTTEVPQSIPGKPSVWPSLVVIGLVVQFLSVALFLERGLGYILDPFDILTFVGFFLGSILLIVGLCGILVIRFRRTR